MPRVGDADFTEDRLVERVNQDLANGYGNLVNRIVTLLANNRPDGPPPPSDDSGLLALADQIDEQVRIAVDRFDLRGAATAVESLIRAANAHIQQQRPWELARDPSPGAASAFDAVLGDLYAVAGRIAGQLEIFTPDLADRARKQLDEISQVVVQPRITVRPGATPG